jgi:hypothetical protein
MDGVFVRFGAAVVEPFDLVGGDADADGGRLDNPPAGRP